MYNYSIEILQKEKNILLKCLSDWELEEYPEAKKEREIKLKNINTSIIILSGIDGF